MRVCGEGGVRAFPSIDPEGDPPKGFGRLKVSRSVGATTARAGPDPAEPLEPDWLLVAKLPRASCSIMEEAVGAWDGRAAGAGGATAFEASTIPSMSSRFISSVISGSCISCKGEIASSEI